MSPLTSSELSLADSSPSPSSTHLISQSPSQSACPSTTLIMKDVSNISRASSRTTAYPKKRPSPYGVSKSRKQSPLHPPHHVVRKSPRATRAEILAQRQREAQIQALRREGIYLEEEYRDEIRFYMQEMEVSSLGSLLVVPLVTHPLHFSASQCPQPLQWTNSQR